MKQFLLFTYSTYYPGGGTNDLKKDFDTLEEAKEYIKKIEADNIEVWDTQTNIIYYLDSDYSRKLEL